MNNLQIEYFLAVAENLSFTKTAEEMFVSQPAVSKHIATLEEELGVALFKRAHRTIELTPAGEQFSVLFIRQKQERDALLANILAFPQERKWPFTVLAGGNWTLASFFPEIVKALEEEAPHIEIKVENHSFEQIPILLNSKQGDIGLTMGASLPNYSRFESYLLTEIPRIIVYSKNSSLGQKEHPAPSDFKDEPFFIPSDDKVSHVVDLVSSVLKPFGFIPEIKSTPNTQSILTNIRNGLGAAVLDSWVVDEEDTQLRFIKLDSTHKVHLVWNKDNRNPALPFVLREIGAAFYPHSDCPFAHAFNTT